VPQLGAAEPARAAGTRGNRSQDSALIVHPVARVSPPGLKSG
jgi:hypothetical protein